MDRQQNSVDGTVKRIYPNLNGTRYKDNVNVGSDHQFKTGDLDYTVAEFYEIFKNELPCLVFIDQGFYGDIIEDTFDREQVILLNTVSTQRRVVGKMVHNSQTMWISIPANYHEKLHVVKKGIVGPAKPLRVILQETNLPCHVLFPEDTTIQVGATSRSSSHLPMIELTHSFDEMFFLGNLVNNSELAMNIVPVPLYLYQLRFKLIKGFTDKPIQEFTNFMGKLKLASSFLNYKIRCGNMNIAEYDTKAVHTGTKFSLIQPNVYTDFMTLARRKPVAPPRMPYRNIPSATPPEVQSRTHGSSTASQHKPTQMPQGGQGNKLVSQGARKSGEPTSSAKQRLLNRPLPPLPHEKAQHTKEDPKDNNSRRQPTHGFVLLAETAGINIPPPTISKHSAETNISSRRPPPEPYPDYGTIWDTQANVATTQASSRHNNETLQYKDKHGSHKAPVNVRALTIVEVGEYLIRLNLHKYRQSFREHMIDGGMLIELDTDILTSNFGMKTVEALRLVKFAKTGNIPT